MTKKLVEQAWTALRGKMVYRAGTKAGWIEVLIHKEDGSEVKLIARKVSRFYSENEVKGVEL